VLILFKNNNLHKVSSKCNKTRKKNIFSGSISSVFMVIDILQLIDNYIFTRQTGKNSQAKL
jgi:hypothetical protein